MTIISNQANRAPRVCFLTESYYPKIADGIALIAHQLATSLSSRGLEILVITRQIEPPSPSLERLGHILIRRVPPSGLMKGKGWRALAPILFFLIRVLYLLIRNIYKYDIIVVFGVKILPIPALLMRFLFRKKCIIRAESPMDLREDISAESLRRMNLSRFSGLLRLVRNLRAGMIRQADCFVAISPEIRRELLNQGWNPGKIRSIPNSIDTEVFRPVSRTERLRIREKLSLPVNKNIFVFTGRIAESKGVLLLIYVWNELLVRYDDLHLVFVGSGSSEVSFDSCEDRLLAYLQQHHLESSVTLTGHVDNVQEYLQASDVFVFPSEYEGFGLAIIEALACGMPSVVTRVGIAPEQIQEFVNGVLADPKDREGFRKSMEWLLDHRELWTQIGTNARNGITDKYSIRVVAEKYLELFRELVKGNKASLQSYSYKDETA